MWQAVNLNTVMCVPSRACMLQKKVIYGWWQVLSMCAALNVSAKGIVRLHNLLFFHKGWSSESYANGDKKATTEAPF